MHPAEAQVRPEATDSVQLRSTEPAGAEVPGKELSVHSGEGGVRGESGAHGDTGQDLVPEPESKGKKARGVGGLSELRPVILRPPSPARPHPSLPHPGYTSW